MPAERRNRSAITGEFVTEAEAKANPETIVSEAVNDTTRVPLAEVERLRLEPGDVIAITFPPNLNVEQMQAAWHTAREAFSDNTVVALDHGFALHHLPPLERAVAALHRAAEAGDRQAQEDAATLEHLAGAFAVATTYLESDDPRPEEWPREAAE